MTDHQIRADRAIPVTQTTPLTTETSTTQAPENVDTSADGTQPKRKRRARPKAPLGVASNVEASPPSTSPLDNSTSVTGADIYGGGDTTLLSLDDNSDDFITDDNGNGNGRHLTSGPNVFANAGDAGDFTNGGDMVLFSSGGDSSEPELFANAEDVNDFTNGAGSDMDHSGSRGDLTDASGNFRVNTLDDLLLSLGNGAPAFQLSENLLPAYPSPPPAFRDASTSQTPDHPFEMTPLSSNSGIQATLERCVANFIYNPTTTDTLARVNPSPIPPAHVVTGAQRTPGVSAPSPLRFVVTAPSTPSVPDRRAVAPTHPLADSSRGNGVSGSSPLPSASVSRVATAPAITRIDNMSGIAPAPLAQLLDLGFPESRPMSNAPVERKASVAGTRGARRGGGRGVRGARGRATPGGRGGRGGGVGGRGDNSGG